MTALPLSVRVGLFAALAVVAVGSLVIGAREQWREGDIPGPHDTRSWWRTARLLLPVEAAVGLVALVSAVAFGQSGGGSPAPAAAVAAASAGSPLLMTGGGPRLVPIAIAPGLPGANRLVVGVEERDADGVLQPAAGVTGVLLRLACDGCGAAPSTLRLAATLGSPWFTGTVTLAAGSWAISPVIEAASPSAIRTVSASIDAARPGDVLVGVPADLSGPFGSACQNHAAGLELAFGATGTSSSGPRPRVVLDDVEAGGPAAAVDRLAGLGVRLLAAPCGQAGTVGDVAGAATRLRLPVVGGLRSEGPSPYVWRTGVDQAAEGAALAAQVRSLGAASALVVAGPRPEQAAEAAAVEAALGREGIAHEGLAIAPGDDPATLATRLRALDPAVLVLVATPRRALPLVEASTRAGWRPARGIVASSDLMSVSFAEDAAPYLDGTPLLVASELDPSDVAAREYAVALHRLSPLRPPGIEGARGYYAGLVVDHAVSASGGDPSPAALEHALQTDFMGWAVGLFRLDWEATGGGPDRLAFFTPAPGGRFVRDGAPVAVG